FQVSRTVQAGSSAAKPGEEGETIAETLAAVIMKDPDWPLLPIDTPPAIHRLLRRCLEKDRPKRLESAAAARPGVDEGLSHPATPLSAGSSVPSTPPARRRGLLGLIVATALVAAAIASVSTWWMFRPLPAPIVRVTVLPTEGLRPGDPTAFPDVAITPDG